MDYGDLLCFASNSVGKQVEPCVFRVIPAEKPDPVTNCTVSNITHFSFVVTCDAGFDGGLLQSFRLQLFDSNQTLLNLTSNVPTFKVVGLQPEKTFAVTVFASNERGRSEKVVLQAFTTKPTISEIDINQAKTGSLKTKLIISPILGVLIGVGSAIVLVSLILFALICIRVKLKKVPRNGSKTAKQHHWKDNRDDLFCNLPGNSPDLIQNMEGIV